MTNIQYDTQRVYKVSRINSFVCFGEFLIWAQDLILFYWEFDESYSYTEYRQLNSALLFVHLITCLHILFCMISPICVRRHFYFARAWVTFHMYWNLCLKSSRSLLRSSEDFNICLYVPYEEKNLYVATE